MVSPRSAPRAPSGRSRPRALLGVALASVAVLGASAAGTVYMKAQAHSGDGVVASSATPSDPESSPVSGAGSGEPAVEPTVDRDRQLGDAMGSVRVEGGAEVSTAVLDLDSGESAGYGEGSFDTASIVKVDILAALLLQAQDEGRQLTGQEKSYATAMIEYSDNTSASALWRAIGKADGLDAANRRLGLTHTEGGDGMLWGLTQTTAADQLTLLQQVFGDDSELTEDSQAYAQGLMERIASGQRWGVSAVADGSEWALKNGWLARSATGLWDINSIGRVTVDGHDYLVAVLSKGNSTKERGVSMVESAAEAAVSVFTGEDASDSAKVSVSASGSAASG